MLQTIRDKATGWIAYVIVGFITIPFLLWGIQSYIGVGGSAKVATVNDTEITVQQFQRELQQQQRQLREMFGGKVPAELSEGMAMKQSVLGGMIRREVLHQVTRDEGWRVSDMAVAEAITATPQFQVGGQFSKQRYEQLLDAQRLNKPAYEAFVRQGLQLDQLREVVGSTGFLTRRDQEGFLRLQGEKRIFDYLVLDRQKYADSIRVSDDEIKAYYDEHKDSFLSPEQVQLEYLKLDRKALAEAVSIDDAEIRAAYEKDSHLYRQPETREASHILIKVKQDASDEEKKQAAEKAQSAYQKLAEGADFAAVAKEYSDDVLSKDNGGKLGKLSRGDMPKAFEDELFALAEGEFSRPVKTDSGYEIIRVEKIEGGEQKPFDEVKQQIAQDLKMQQVDRQFAELADELVTLTYENPESLSVAADDLGLAIQETGWITRNGGEGVAADSKVVAAAFSDDVLAAAQNSDAIELDDGSVVVVRVKEHKPAAPRSFEEVEGEIAELLQKKKLAAVAKEKGTELLKALEGGAELSALAENSGAKVEHVETGRVDDKVPAAVLHAVFSLPAEGAGKRFRGVALPNGDYAIVMLKDVAVPEITAEQLKDNPELQRLLAEYNDRYYDALYKAMEARQDIEVYSEQLQ